MFGRWKCLGKEDYLGFYDPVSEYREGYFKWKRQIGAYRNSTIFIVEKRCIYV